jgi:hypothetical protein
LIVQDASARFSVASRRVRRNGADVPVNDRQHLLREIARLRLPVTVSELEWIRNAVVAFRPIDGDPC